MPWVRFDDQFPIHRKIDGLSDAAFRLHVSAICWSARNLTDGRISAAELRMVARMRRPDKFVDELCRSGLWRRVDGGWLIHDYLEFQPSRSKVEKGRVAKAERQRRWLDKRKNGPVEKPVDRDASIDASQDDAPSPPRPEGSGAGDRPRARGAPGRTGPTGPAGRAVPPWCGQCSDDVKRQIELDDGRVARCPECHPLREDTA
ncbi:hypothetical protein [Actinomadura rupiterrae]|uniref:hypothetical protein n=1 Tax=Actinomadura rupiterrae TaxID=559627 RepID=UPI0020A5CD7C|nr:hypothetical protein [Actinomadura rupiterrae]MCP2339203.1 hypothetical protein [Actinomadura rupiterrae]